MTNQATGAAIKVPATLPPSNANLFEELRTLDWQLKQKEYNLHERAVVLIYSCIERGINTKGQIIGTLRQIGFKHSHIAIMLKEHDGDDPKRHSWRIDGEGLVHLLT